MEKLNKETIKRISNSPGIYYIKNIVNGKGYIGKSSKLRRRLYDPGTYEVLLPEIVVTPQGSYIPKG